MLEGTQWHAADATYHTAKILATVLNHDLSKFHPFIPSEYWMAVITVKLLFFDALP